MNPFLKKMGKKIISNLYSIRFPERFKLTQDQEWDVCIIFDACRYDLFKKYNTIEGNLEKVYSPGSCTTEWFEKSFFGCHYPDITYISTNPLVSNYMLRKRGEKNPFKEIIDLWMYGWSDEMGTVMPKIVNDVAFNLIKKREGKFIVHYIQPHYPFVGKIKILDKKMNELKNKIENKSHSSKTEGVSPWADAKNGIKDLKEVIRAYESNCEYIILETQEFISSLDKNIFITSDHGNAYGRFGAYGHPANFHIPETVEVPLLKIMN